MTDMETLANEIRELKDLIAARTAPRDAPAVEIPDLRDIRGSLKVWRYIQRPIGPVSDIVIHCWPGPGPAPIHAAYPRLLELLERVMSPPEDADSAGT